MFKLLLSLLVALAINSPGISERKQRGKLSSFDEFDSSVKDRVMQSLLNQLEEYENLRNKKLELGASTDSLDILIRNTNKMISDREEIVLSEMSDVTNSERQFASQGSSSGPSPIECRSIITAAIDFFRAANYKFSEELLTVSYDYCDIGTYTPVFSSVVYSSSVTRDIAFGDSQTYSYKISSITDYLSASHGEQDLALAIGGFDVLGSVDVSSHTFTINDTYDFDSSKNYDGQLADLITVFDYLVDAGYLSTFDIRVDVDYSELLVPDVVSKSGNKFSVKINNFSSTARTVLYNSKLTNWSDARDWSWLSDIKNITLAPHSFAEVVVVENGTATSLAMAFIESNRLCISFADGIQVGANTNLEISEKRLHEYNGLTLLGKDSGSWVFRAVNRTSFANSIEYVNHMVTQSTAIGWTNTLDVELRTLMRYGNVFIRVSEYGTNGYVSFRFRNGNTMIYVYANELENQDQTMAAYNRPDCPFLSLINNGKSGGKWSITVLNLSAVAVNLEYNAKLCFSNDASRWTNLSDVNADIELNPGVQANVSISSNFMAGCVAFSFVYLGYRFITYGNGLTNGGGISVSTNVVEAN